MKIIIKCFSLYLVSDTPNFLFYLDIEIFSFPLSLTHSQARIHPQQLMKNLTIEMNLMCKRKKNRRIYIFE